METKKGKHAIPFLDLGAGAGDEVGEITPEKRLHRQGVLGLHLRMCEITLIF